MRPRERSALTVVYDSLYADDVRLVIPKARAVLALLIQGEFYIGELEEAVMDLLDAVKQTETEKGASE